MWWLVGCAEIVPSPPAWTPQSPLAPPELADVGIELGLDTNAFQIVDLNGDGAMDLVAEVEGELHVFEGPLSSLGEPRLRLPLPDPLSWVDLARAGDLNGDGAEDLALSIYYGGWEANHGATQLLFGDTRWDRAGRASLLLAAPDRQRSALPVHVPLGDLRGDGFPDLAIAWPGDGRVFAVDGQTSGGAPALDNAWAVLTSEAEDITLGAELASADTDQDGAVDLLLIDDPDRSQVHLVETRAWADASALHAQHLEELGTILLRAEDGARDTVLAAGDAGGDGQLDLFVAGRVLGGQMCVLSSPPAGPGTHEVEALGSCSFSALAPWQARFVDLDQDGADELVISEGSLDDRASRLTVLRAHELEDPIETALLRLPLVGRSIAVGDLTGDGTPDLLTGSPLWLVPGERLVPWL
jgi:hypothetical protein